MIVEYTMARGEVWGDLCRNVNTRLAAGWKLYGSPFTETGVMYQALVREEQK